MLKLRLVLPVIVLACFFASGVLIATNMGFKFNRVLNGTGSSEAGTNWIALPYFKQAGMADAKDLIDDIVAEGGSVGQVGRFINSADAFQTYNGSTGTAFTLAKSEGLVVTMITDSNYMMFGTHDPGHVVNFNGSGTSASGMNFYAPPYHTTSINAGELRDEINANQPGSAISIQRFDNAKERIQTFDGVSGYNFPIEPNKAYFVQVASDVSFIPSHY